MRGAEASAGLSVNRSVSAERDSGKADPREASLESTDSGFLSLLYPRSW